jgi:hypothetical protein
MTKRAAQQPLLVNFSRKEAEYAVTRKTVKAMRERLGFSTETQVVQYALATLRDTVLPRYEGDDGPVPDVMLRHIRRLVSQDTSGGKSLL